MDDEDRHQLIRHLFAVVTGMLEDAAAVAAEGQARGSSESFRLQVHTLETIIRQTETITRAIGSLTLDPPAI